MSDAAPEGFARRWSRLKRQSPELAPAPAPTPPLAVEPEPLQVEMPPDAATIPLEDITAWLGRTIPEGWREIALRRMWSADISIRDFIGPADYAWDWNTPGGAPGWGPMRVADDLVRLLSRAIGEDLPIPETPAQAGTVEEPAIALADPVCDPSEAAADIAPGDPPTYMAPEIEPIPVRPRRGGRATPV